MASSYIVINSSTSTTYIYTEIKIYYIIVYENFIIIFFHIVIFLNNIPCLHANYNPYMVYIISDEFSLGEFSFIEFTGMQSA